MAERGREKGRRTAAETEREALARSGTDGGYQTNAAPKLQESHRRKCREREIEKCENGEKKRSSYLRQIDRSPR